jgi:hypothetical protein
VRTIRRNLPVGPMVETATSWEYSKRGGPLLKASGAQAHL